MVQDVGEFERRREADGGASCTEQLISKLCGPVSQAAAGQGLDEAPRPKGLDKLARGIAMHDGLERSLDLGGCRRRRGEQGRGFHEVPLRTRACDKPD